MKFKIIIGVNLKGLNKPFHTWGGGGKTDKRWKCTYLLPALI